MCIWFNILRTFSPCFPRACPMVPFSSSSRVFKWSAGSCVCRICSRYLLDVVSVFLTSLAPRCQLFVSGDGMLTVKLPSRFLDENERTCTTTGATCIILLCYRNKRKRWAWLCRIFFVALIMHGEGAYKECIMMLYEYKVPWMNTSTCTCFVSQDFRRWIDWWTNVVVACRVIAFVLCSAILCLVLQYFILPSSFLFLLCVHLFHLTFSHNNCNYHSHFTCTSLYDVWLQQFENCRESSRLSQSSSSSCSFKFFQMSPHHFVNAVTMAY